MASAAQLAAKAALAASDVKGEPAGWRKHLDEPGEVEAPEGVGMLGRARPQNPLFGIRFPGLTHGKSRRIRGGRRGRSCWYRLEEAAPSGHLDHPGDL